MENKNWFIALDPDSIRKVAITCKCSTRTVHDTPDFMFDVSSAMLILECPVCHTSYGLLQGRVCRLDDNYRPVNKVNKFATGEIIDGSYVVPGNDTVN